MLALAAADAVAVVLFGTLYAVAGARVLPQLAFVACLGVLFVLMTALWVRTEARHRRLTPVRRLGRVVIGLLIVFVATPVIVLGPLFWLAEQLPVEAGLHAAQGGVMALGRLRQRHRDAGGGDSLGVRRARGARRAFESVTPPSGRISA